MRIVSFLPAATEIVHALGAGDDLVGRSHECDFPSGVERLPVVSRPALDMSSVNPGEIDRRVADRMQTGDSMYVIDERLLRDLRPDVILTQNLCRVCAPSGNELSRAVRDFDTTPEILFLTPRSMSEIEENVLAVGTAIGRSDEARVLIDRNRTRMAALRTRVSSRPRKSVAFLEWTDPIFCAGHWVPEMIEMAGGLDPLGRPAADSVRVAWSDVVGAEPQVVIVSPCGFGLSESARLARDLPAIDAEVFAVDANAYFARPGPRYAESVELLAHLFHPDLAGWQGRTQPWERIA